jgi:hypothetical protein
MKSLRPLTNEWKLLYESGLSLNAIGDRYGVTKQAVHDRLKRAGVEIRSKKQAQALRFIPIERDILDALYVEKRMSIAAVAERLGVSCDQVKRSMRTHGIKARRSGHWRKYTLIDTMKVGEAHDFPRPQSKGTWHANFYQAAKIRGMRVRVRIVDESTVKVMRVE